MHSHPGLEGPRARWQTSTWPDGGSLAPAPGSNWPGEQMVGLIGSWCGKLRPHGLLKAEPCVHRSSCTDSQRGWSPGVCDAALGWGCGLGCASGLGRSCTGTWLKQDLKGTWEDLNPNGGHPARPSPETLPAPLAALSPCTPGAGCLQGASAGGDSCDLSAGRGARSPLSGWLIRSVHKPPFNYFFTFTLSTCL